MNPCRDVTNQQDVNRRCRLPSLRTDFRTLAVAGAVGGFPHRKETLTRTDRRLTGIKINLKAGKHLLLWKWRRPNVSGPADSFTGRRLGSGGARLHADACARKQSQLEVILFIQPNSWLTLLHFDLQPLKTALRPVEHQLNLERWRREEMEKAESPKTRGNSGRGLGLGFQTSRRHVVPAAGW